MGWVLPRSVSYYRVHFPGDSDRRFDELLDHCALWTTIDHPLFLTGSYYFQSPVQIPSLRFAQIFYFFFFFWPIITLCTHCSIIHVLLWKRNVKNIVKFKKNTSIRKYLVDQWKPNVVRKMRYVYPVGDHTQNNTKWVYRHISQQRYTAVSANISQW